MLSPKDEAIEVGNALLDQKKYSEAIEQFQKAIEKDPDYAVAYDNWGNALANRTK